MGSLDEWAIKARDRHMEAVARGEHDDACEWDGAKGFHICNCAVRRRKASGFTTPPEDLYFPPPDCTHCAGGLQYDGDAWCCPKCHVSWDSDGTNARFNDDHGDLSRCNEHGIRAHSICQQAHAITAVTR